MSGQWGVPNFYVRVRAITWTCHIIWGVAIGRTCDWIKKLNTIIEYAIIAVKNQEFKLAQSNREDAAASISPAQSWTALSISTVGMSGNNWHKL